MLKSSFNNQLKSRFCRRFNLTGDIIDNIQSDICELAVHIRFLSRMELAWHPTREGFGKLHNDNT